MPERSELYCGAHPPTCDAGACPPFSRAAMLALPDLSPRSRAERLRSWLCDAEGGARAEATLREAADVLREALPAFTFDEQNSAAAPAAAKQGDRVSAAEARRLLCELPWSGLLGRERLLADVRCPPCTPAGGVCDGPQASPVPRVCMFAYAQSYRFDFRDQGGVAQLELPQDITSCGEAAGPSNHAVEEIEGPWAREKAKITVAQLRGSGPLDAAKWKELVDASIRSDYPGGPHRGPRSVVRDASEPDETALRAKLQPLLAKARHEGTEADEKTIAPKPIAALAFAGGFVVSVCDDAPGARREGLFWMDGDRPVAIHGPILWGLETEDVAMQCPTVIDVADLDGDGKPEVIYEDADGATIVKTLADPPIERGVVQPRAGPAGEENDESPE